MFCAAIYNLLWGAVISVYPQLILFGNPPTTYLLILIRCIGMLVGVYGIGYYFCSTDAARYWPLILVGLIGKVLGPAGAICYVALGDMPASFLWLNVFNDMIWIVPFSWVLYQVWKSKV